MWDLRTLAQSQGSEARIRGQFKIIFFGFVYGVKSRELGGKVSPGFSCVTPVMASFSSKLLQAIITFIGQSRI